MRRRLSAYVRAFTPKPFAWGLSSFFPSSLGRQWWQPGWWGRELGSSIAPHHAPEGKKSASKEARQVLLSGSLVSMATGSSLLQLLTPQSLCHPIFSWKTKERGKVVGVWGGESWETFLVFAGRRLTHMQPCLAFNHKFSPRSGGFRWDSSDLTHGRSHTCQRHEEACKQQPSHPPQWVHEAAGLWIWPWHQNRKVQKGSKCGEKKLSLHHNPT